MPELKTIKLRVKDADSGTVEAVFSTFNVVDSDGDVTLPDAFEDGAAVRISAYGHRSWEGALPVGRGTIKTTDAEAILEGGFFLDTEAGRETFATVRGMGDLQEWSYGFDIAGDEETPGSYEGEFEGQSVRFLQRMKVHEVSPVMLGAGVDTRTLAVKGRAGSMKFTEHIATAETVVKEAAARAQERASKRAEQGRALSQADRAHLVLFAETLKSATDAVDAVLSDPEEEGDGLVLETTFMEVLNAH